MDETKSKYFKDKEIESNQEQCMKPDDLEELDDKKTSSEIKDHISSVEKSERKNENLNSKENNKDSYSDIDIEDSDNPKVTNDNVNDNEIKENNEKDNKDSEPMQLQSGDYSDKDFNTDSDEELLEAVKSNSNTDSDDNMMGASTSHRKKKESEPEAKKYKQSRLSFSKTEPRTTRSKEKLKKEGKWSLTKRWSDRDTQNYRDGYPGKIDDPNLNDNLKFYTGKIKSTPDGDYIDTIHEDWWGNFQLLESHHGYIQWLFPIREDGMNWQAQALQLHEAMAIKENKKASVRVLRSYELMLDFYGMKLADPDTGKVERSENWRECFENLSWSSHNYLRITRILKSLGELGLERLKTPWLEFLLHEALVTKKLSRTLNSCRDYWIGTVRSEADRYQLYTFVEEHS